MGMQLRLLYGGIPCPQDGILKTHNYGETQIMPFGKGLVLVGVSYPVIHRISYRMGIIISLSPCLPLVAVTLSPAASRLSTEGSANVEIITSEQGQESFNLA